MRLRDVYGFCTLVVVEVLFSLFPLTFLGLAIFFCTIEFWYLVALFLVCILICLPVLVLLPIKIWKVIAPFRGKSGKIVNIQVLNVRVRSTRCIYRLTFDGEFLGEPMVGTILAAWDLTVLTDRPIVRCYKVGDEYLLLKPLPSARE